MIEQLWVKLVILGVGLIGLCVFLGVARWHYRHCSGCWKCTPR